MPNFVKRFQTALIVGGSVIVAAIVLYAALISPQGTKLNSLHSKEAQLQTQETQLQQEIATLKRDKANIASNCAALAKAITEIPDKPNVSSFLQQVTALAVGTGNPNTPTIAVTQAPASAGTAGVSAITVALTLNGDYGQMSAFIKGLDSFPRLFSVTSINVAGGTSSTSAGASNPVVSGGGGINPATSPYTLSLSGTVYYNAAAVTATVCSSTSTTTTAPAA